MVSDASQDIPRQWRDILRQLRESAKEFAREQRVQGWRRLPEAKVRSLVEKFFSGRTLEKISKCHEWLVQLAITRPYPGAARPAGAGKAAAGVLASGEALATYGHPLGGLAGGLTVATLNGLIQTYLGASVLVQRMRALGTEPTREKLYLLLAKAWGKWPQGDDRAESRGFTTRQVGPAQAEIIGEELLDLMKEQVADEMVGLVLA